MAAVFDEEQIYRIDHYLGKETVQNLLVFRFANGVFGPIWNRRYIDHVQIAVAEELGVENRGSYYEEAGLLRDMIQNHVLLPGWGRQGRDSAPGAGRAPAAGRTSGAICSTCEQTRRMVH